MFNQFECKMQFNQNSCEEYSDSEDCSQQLNSYKKDSFSSRICDDLCEVIVSYLPIGDKIRLESVSKQFQRVLFSRHYVLNIDDHTIEDKNTIKQLTEMKEKPNIFIINTILLENVLKKFSYINEIQISKSFKKTRVEFENIDQTLSVIANNCHHLKCFTFNSDGDIDVYNKQILVYFGTKLGQNLKTIRFGCRDRKSLRLLLDFCPNLLSIIDVDIRDLIQESVIKCEKVRKIWKLRVYDYKPKLIDIFIAHFSQQLTHLSIDLLLDTVDEENSLIEKCSQLQCLVYLKIKSDLGLSFLYSSRLPLTIKSIAQNCKQLKSFTFSTHIRETFDSKQFCDSFAYFSQLKRFSFANFSNESGVFDFNCLMSCKQLTHLTLGLNRLNDQCFDNFDLLFPNLVSLNINNENKLSEQTVNTIKKIKNLKIFLRNKRVFQDFEYNYY